MMSGPHALHAGDGYEYLTRQVASGDRERDRARDLTDYYTEHGTPPGKWFGKGAEQLGISGEVTERQMQALFGEGLHPDADRIIAEALAQGKTAQEAVEAAKLGAVYSEFTSKKTPISEIYDRRLDQWIEENHARPNHDVRMMLRTDAAREFLHGKLGRKPTTEEINNALATEKKQTKRAVAGFDCVFTPPKSWSVAWGLGDDKLRRALYECHRDAVLITLGWAEDHFALARRGKGGEKQIDADGLTIAMFEHYDNRTGDPNPHTHCVISTKTSADVLDKDGNPVLDKNGNPKKKWSSLDARSLFGGATALSCMYNAVSVDLAKRRLGFDFVAEDRGRGKEPVLEIADIPRELREEFSRRADIVRRTEELAADYRAKHGRDPSKRIQHKLAQQATLDTRNAKPVPKSLREMITEWNDRARGLLSGLSGAEFINRVRRWHTDPSSRPFDPERVAISVGVALGGKLATIASDPVERSRVIESQLVPFEFASRAARDDAWWEVAQLLDPRSTNNVLDKVARAAQDAKDRVYDREEVSRQVLETVSRRRATWNEAHIRAATYDRLARCDFSDDSGLRTAAEEVVATVRDRHSILMTIDPDEPPKRVQRRNGESQYNTLNMTTVLYTSQAVLDAEDFVREATRTPTAHILTRAAVDAAIGEVERSGQQKHGSDYRLNDGQKAIVRHLCMSGMRHDVAVGPAGAGKTTAMEAVVKAWLNDGRDVIALSPQKSAAEVLAADIGIPATTIDSLLVRMRTGNHPGIQPGTMMLVDEAAMASTAQLYQLQKIADQHGAVVRCIGDPYQLSAVESGGLMRLIAQETKAPILSDVVRFTTSGEDKASLNVRNGDPVEAFEWYQDHERITSGMTDDLRSKILHEYLRDQATGTRSLMMAATLADVAALNGAAQAALGLSGQVAVKGASHRLADGHRGYVGDIIVTRRNTNKLRVTGGKKNGASVDNGNLWTIKKVHRDGSLTAVGVGHRGKVHLPSEYVKADVELGYATTVHRAQGMTVERAYLLLNKTLGRALAYVGLTRGRRYNGVYVATDAVPDPAIEIQPDDEGDELTELELWMRVMACEDDNLTATEVMRREQARMNDPKRTRAIYDDVTAMLAEQRAHALLERALPTALWREVSTSSHLQTLIDTIAVADHHRLNTQAMVTSIATNDDADLGESLAEAKDLTAVLRARADRWIRERIQPLAAPISTAAVETFAVDPLLDQSALIASVTATNTTSESLSTTERGGRFYAVRDALVSGVPPVPPRHSGMDPELLDYAEELRTRLIGGTTAPTASHPPAPTNPTERAAELDSYNDTVDPAARRAKIRRDYESYVAELVRDHARYLLDRALPAALLRTVEHGRSFRDLLDTIALADAHRLNTAALVADITSNGGRDYGESLLTARDAAALLRARADDWIHRNLVNVSVDNPTVATLAVTDDTDTAAITQSIIASNTGTDVFAVSAQPGKFRALDDLPLPRGLRPIPAEYPGMDVSVADYADELRRRLLGLPDDAPDWRARAAQQQPPEVDETDEFDLADDDWLAAPQPDLPYPELDSGERVRRLRAELEAARTQVALLNNPAWDAAIPHILAIEPILDHVRARRDELAAPLRRLRSIRAEWEEAERDAEAAEDTLERALRSDPEPIDEQWLALIESEADPTVGDQLSAALDELRTAMEQTAVAQRDATIAQAQLVADSARSWADELRTQVDAAQRELDTAAAGRIVADSRDVGYIRDYAAAIATADLVAARERVIPLNHYLARARAIAIDELVDQTGLTRGAAALEVDTRFQPTREEIDAALTTVVGRGQPQSSTDLTGLDNNGTADATIEAARRHLAEVASAVDNGLNPPPIGDEPVARMVRAHADALMPWAVAAHAAELAATIAETQALDAETDYARLRNAEPNPWAEKDPFLTQLAADLAALPEDAPQRDQLSAMLDQYHAAAADSAAATTQARLHNAEQTAAAARAHADQLRAEAERARQELANHLADPLGSDTRTPVQTFTDTEAAQPTRSVTISTRPHIDLLTQPEITVDTPLNQAAAIYLATLNRDGHIESGQRDHHAPAWLPAPPPVENTTAIADLARRQYSAITARTTALAEQATDTQPDWTAHLGPIPHGAVARAEWIDLAGQVAAWREQFSITTQTSLLGEHPDDENQAEIWERLTAHAAELRTRAIERHQRDHQHQSERGRQEREHDTQRRPIQPNPPDHHRGIDI
ncbi:MobF family relaxase [Nocardia sp. CY41]|uniref:MobF family relaxase n=1 Tax=Nocardia sp. CY41 TaxID=2608686 RepID=UPI0013589CE1|nr:MobF family relaxase [Nocardia sp. CY41]